MFSMLLENEDLIKEALLEKMGKLQLSRILTIIKYVVF
jgi:hypothetical protein